MYNALFEEVSTDKPVEVDELNEDKLEALEAD
jgi:hypothetical protein